jgi:hypothetical protein
MNAFPGCGAARSSAPLIRDRSRLGTCDDPGSAAHHFVLRCARETVSAQGTGNSGLPAGTCMSKAVSSAAVAA